MNKERLQKIKDLADKIVKDPKDKELLFPQSLFFPNRPKDLPDFTNHQWEEFVKAEDFISLAERFVLAMELINLMEEREVREETEIYYDQETIKKKLRVTTSVTFENCPSPEIPFKVLSIKGSYALLFKIINGEHLFVIWNTAHESRTPGRWGSLKEVKDIFDKLVNDEYVPLLSWINATVVKMSDENDA